MLEEMVTYKTICIVYEVSNFQFTSIIRCHLGTDTEYKR